MVNKSIHYLDEKLFCTAALTSAFAIIIKS
jgi:hypothetical protein